MKLTITATSQRVANVQICLAHGRMVVAWIVLANAHYSHGSHIISCISYITPLNPTLTAVLRGHCADMDSSTWSTQMTGAWSRGYEKYEGEVGSGV